MGGMVGEDEYYIYVYTYIHRFIAPDLTRLMSWYANVCVRMSGWLGGWGGEGDTDRDMDRDTNRHFACAFPCVSMCTCACVCVCCVCSTPRHRCVFLNTYIKKKISHADMHKYATHACTCSTHARARKHTYTNTEVRITRIYRCLMNGKGGKL